MSRESPASAPQRRSRVELLLALQAALGFLGGVSSLLRYRALALIALRLARGGELYEQVLLILAASTVAFLCLGALLHFIGRWLGQQDDSLAAG